MITGKQKRYLRNLANSVKATHQLGKEGLSCSFIEEVKRSLKKRELIKISVLQSSPLKKKQAAEKTAELTGSELVQVIGRKVVLYKKSEESPVIKLPE